MSSLLLQSQVEQLLLSNDPKKRSSFSLRSSELFTRSLQSAKVPLCNVTPLLANPNKIPLEIYHLIMERYFAMNRSCIKDLLPLLLVCKTWLPHATRCLYYLIEPTSTQSLTKLALLLARPEYQSRAESIRVLKFPLLLHTTPSYDGTLSQTECQWLRFDSVDDDDAEDEIGRPISKRSVPVDKAGMDKLCGLYESVASRCTRLYRLQIPFIIFRRLYAAGPDRLEETFRTVTHLSFIAIERGELLEVRHQDLTRIFPNLVVLRISNFTLDPGLFGVPHKLRKLHLHCCIVPQGTLSVFSTPSSSSLRTLVIGGGLTSTTYPSDICSIFQSPSSQNIHLALEGCRLLQVNLRQLPIRHMTVVYDRLEFWEPFSGPTTWFAHLPQGLERLVISNHSGLSRPQGKFFKYFPGIVDGILEWLPALKEVIVEDNQSTVQKNKKRRRLSVEMGEKMGITVGWMQLRRAERRLRKASITLRYKYNQVDLYESLREKVVWRTTDDP